MKCDRCKNSCSNKDNYCSYCGMPLNEEIMRMVRTAYEKKRKHAVHNILSLLINEGCINKKSLNKLMAKLHRIFGED